MNGIPDDVLAELKWLSEQSSQVRGSTPLDDPKRRAGDDFCKLVMKTIENYGATFTSISRALGLSDANVRLKVGRHGYIPNPPSQKTYRGIKTTKPLKTHCKRGHAMEGANLHIRPEDGSRVCVACRRLRDRQRYAEGKR